VSGGAFYSRRKFSSSRLSSSDLEDFAMCETVPEYRLKIERAKRHIRELAKEVEAFNVSKPYEIFPEENATLGQRHWKVKVKKNPPQAWSGIVGDAIHNARAALDLLAVAVVRHDDPARASYNHVHFVIRETKDEFEAALGKNIKGASAESRRGFEDLKPYKGGDEAFWRLHQLDIMDKHKAIIPVWARHKATGLTLDPVKIFPSIFAGIKAAPVGITIGIDGSPALKDGATLHTEPIDFPANKPPEFTVTIAFGEGQIVGGEPVIPALTQMCEFVEGVCATFEKSILSK
jgi:hypothetical protein